MPPKNLSELKQEEIHINKLKNILNGGVSMECKEEVKSELNELKPQLKHKICPDCHKDKPINEYHINRSSEDGYVKYCKLCVKAKRTLQEDEHAKDTFYNEIIPYTKDVKVFTQKDIWSRIASTEHKAYLLLANMVKNGLLSVTKKGNMNYYEVAGKVESKEEVTTPKREGQYNGLSEILEEHQCSNICLDKPSKFRVYNKNGDDPDIQIQPMITDPITESDIKNLESLGIKTHEDIGRDYIPPYQPEETMLKLISSIYNKADEIKLVPISHEIHIKLKEV